jgi:aspartate-semialdehyde dehydrogenase
MAKTKAGVLGATGSVGQRFILLLANHPDFELVKLGASSRSAGKKYKDACNWKQTDIIPEYVENLVVVECKSEFFQDCDIVFSGLDADYAGIIEQEFADNGLGVISNAKNHRQDPEVPLVVPIINPEHLALVENKILKSKEQGTNKGFIVCISNCSTAGLVAPLKPLVEKFGPLKYLITTTMQAVSGAGFSPGVGSMDILDNVIPYIGGEEEKMEWETKKILGSISADGLTIENIPESELKVSASCNRVAVIDGHTECVSFSFKSEEKPSVDEVKQCLKDYQCEATQLGVTSAPKQTIHVLDQNDRPQPRLDRNRDAGYAVSVGRVRKDTVLDFKMVVLSHNTIIGAAGSGILIAEILRAKKLI